MDDYEEDLEDEPQEEIRIVKGPLPTMISFTETDYCCKPKVSEKITLILSDSKSFPKGLFFSPNGVRVTVTPDLTDIPDIRFAFVKISSQIDPITIDEITQNFSISDLESITFHNGPDAEKEKSYENFKVS